MTLQQYREQVVKQCNSIGDMLQNGEVYTAENHTVHVLSGVMKTMISIMDLYLDRIFRSIDFTLPDLENALGDLLWYTLNYEPLDKDGPELSVLMEMILQEVGTPPDFTDQEAIAILGLEMSKTIDTMQQRGGLLSTAIHLIYYLGADVESVAFRSLANTGEERKFS